MKALYYCRMCERKFFPSLNNIVDSDKVVKVYMKDGDMIIEVNPIADGDITKFVVDGIIPHSCADGERIGVATLCGVNRL